MNLKLMADENIDNRIIKILKKNNYNIISIAKNHKGITDEEVLNLALSEKSILITKDSDFGEYIFSHKFSSLGVIYLRYDALKYIEISQSLLNTLRKYNSNLYGKFVVISINKIRIRDIIQ